jgi:putative membrane protein
MSSSRSSSGSNSYSYTPVKFPLKTTIAVLVIIYLIGLVGLYYQPTRELFMALTPLNLVVSAILLFSFHRQWNPAFGIFAVVVYIFSLLLEMIGTHTGYPFGSYRYGESLGAMVYSTPWIIGLNWLMLVYATGSIARRFPVMRLARAFIGAVLMVILDIAMEPIAMKLDFWQWKGDVIPLSNYVTWFFAAFLFHVLYQLSRFRKTNDFGLALYLTMLGFFVALNFLI